jgi:hypothetical protein
MKKIAQNVAQPIFLSKSTHNHTRGKNIPKKWATSVFFNLPKKNNHPMDEKSPNLVTLAGLFL